MKRIISTLLITVLLIGLMPTIAFASPNEFAGGSGTESDPYLISTKYHLDNVRNYLDAHFKMIADIEFADADFAEGGDFYNDGQCWAPIAMFSGMFDGNGHTVKNLCIISFDDYAGLFGRNRGTIKHLGLIDSNVSFSDSGIAYVGGIAGANDGTIENCYNTGTISSSDFAGGIAGSNGGTIKNCYNTGTVAFSFYAGGIAGYNNIGATIKNCYNTGTVSSPCDAGGIVAHNRSTIENCYNTGAVSSSCDAGGIAGYNYFETTIENCYYLNTISKGVGSGEDTATKCTADKMKLQATYADFDFENVWIMTGNECYPYPELNGIAFTSGHMYDNVCDATCDCGFERTVTHDYQPAYDSENHYKECTVCGDKIEIVAHIYENACDTSCNICGAVRSITHTYSNDCDAECNVCHAIRSVGPHKYNNACDTDCNECGSVRLITHTYTNACDAICNICGGSRAVSHDYSNDCDSYCNTCSTYRTPPHIYTNDCDTTCNECGAERTITHTYSYSCDATCDVCGDERTVTHDYQPAYDSDDHYKKCSVCGDKIEIATHVFDDNFDTNCNICGATVKKNIDAPSAPTLFEKTTTSIILTLVDGYEYSMDGIKWQKNPVFSGLTANTEYTFYQRIGETDTNYASSSSPVLLVTTAKYMAKEPKSPVVIAVSPTSITLAPYTGYEYSMDGVVWQDDNHFTGLIANTKYTFCQRIAEINDTCHSVVSAEVKATTLAKNPCSISPIAPIIESYTTSSVTLVAIDGYEYRRGTEGTWQDSTVFNGLSSNSSYTFYQRIKECDDELASVSSTGVTAKTLSTSSGTTSAINYDLLRSYIDNYGEKDSSGIKTIVVSEPANNGTRYYLLQNQSSGIKFLYYTKGTGSRVETVTEFVLTRNSKYISTYSVMSYYTGSSLFDSATGSINIDKSIYSPPQTTYKLNSNGQYLTSENLSNNFNLSLELLCLYFDVYLYSELGFGLKALGFTSYYGKGSSVCDAPSSYHTGSYVTRFAREARCTIDGYTGDTYCSTCNTKISSGSSISSEGHHEYSDSCDNTCNICGEERRIDHVYDGACDHKCNICEEERAMIDHTYEGVCDDTCNECGFKRNAPHQCDNCEDLICTVCGATRSAESHDYDNTCDTTCNKCGAVRTITHTYSNDCDTECNVCRTIRSVGPHQYDNDCDTICNECREPRNVEPHAYDDTCDITCNKCGAVRSITHTYSNDCDAECNVCHAIRSVGPHKYNNACDTDCNECGSVRTVGDHQHTNACDTTCNICGNTRTVGEHKYDNACDKDCNECGAVRTPVAHKGGTATCKAKAVCTVCGASYGSLAGHKFGSYVYNNDATASKDGTKTRTCSVCQKTETVTATGTKLVNPFKDVDLKQYYAEPVLWAVGKNITNGMSADSFAPNNECTRGQIVTFLWRAAGSPEPTRTKNPFKDVSSSAYYYKAVLWAVEKGITTGTSANTFSPDAACTRGQVVTFLWRAKGKPAAYGSNAFKDVQKGAYYYDAVRWAVANNITNGMSATSFAPDATCTRGQIVTFLYRAYK